MAVMPRPGGGRRPQDPAPPPETPTEAPAEGTEGTEEFTLLPLGLGWEGSIFNGDAGRRFAWILFVFLTYRLAFGRNDAGEYHVESGVNSAMDLYGRGYGYRQEPKKTRAVLRANVAGATVARRTNRRTSRRGGFAAGVASTERKLKASRTAEASRTSSASRTAPAEKQKKPETAEDQVAKQRAAKRGRDKAEARSALQNLGYSKTEANQLLVQAGDQPSPEAYIQAALRKRGKAV